MTKKPKAAARERRQLFRYVRTKLGSTLKKVGDEAGVSESMLSRFEAGHNDLSLDKWASVLEALSKLAQGDGNLAWDLPKRIAGLVEAQSALSKLGTSVAQSAHSASLEERLYQYALLDEPEDLDVALEQRQDVLDIARQAVYTLGVARGEIDFWRQFAEKYDVVRDLLGLRDKKTAIEEAETAKMAAVGLERAPDPEFETLRSEIADHGKKERE